MSARDDELRRLVDAGLTTADIDVRSLTIEITDGHMTVQGAVPTLAQKMDLTSVLREQVDNSVSLDCDVAVRDDAPLQAGRPALTATSVD